jgi:hypothetical protein
MAFCQHGEQPPLRSAGPRKLWSGVPSTGRSEGFRWLPIARIFGLGAYMALTAFFRKLPNALKLHAHICF